MKSVDVCLAAYDALEVALRAETLDQAVEEMRADLNVLSRDDVIRVAMAIVWETTHVLVPRADRPRLLERTQRRRLSIMMAGS